MNDIRKRVSPKISQIPKAREDSVTRRRPLYTMHSRDADPSPAIELYRSIPPNYTRPPVLTRYLSRRRFVRPLDAKPYTKSRFPFLSPPLCPSLVKIYTASWNTQHGDDTFRRLDDTCVSRLVVSRNDADLVIPRTLPAPPRTAYTRISG